MLDAVIDYLPSPLDVPADHRPRPAHRRRGRPHPRRQGAVRALAFKIAADPFVGKLAFFRVYSGTLKAGSYVLNPTQGQEGAHRPHPADARQPPRGDRRGLRGRHRRGRRPQGHLHRRHADRPRPPDRARVDDVPRAGHRGRRSSPRPRPTRTSSRIALQRLAEEDPTFRVHTDPETGRDAHRRHGRAAPRRARRPHGARVQGRRQRRQAAGLLPRDDPPRRRGQRPLRPPDRRQAASTATRSSSSSPTRRAPATSSSTRSSAAPSRASTSSRSTRASARRSRPASTPATRWSTSR